MGLLKRLPVVSKDLLEDIPVPRGGCHHRIAPSGGDQIVAMERLYHAAAASSTPHPASLRYPHATRLSLMNESFRDRKNAFSYTIEIHEAEMKLGFSVSLFCLLPQLLGFYARQRLWHCPIISSAYPFCKHS